ncbi:hypothetical protein [Urbanus proteus nucleopolyhedrovirus]|uniref:Uncharacterized protein n=1 Tax=Urbanus proteus nucleopolyhedrovirus TaxID=1675866 RepID=A0A162GV38_9ABAC|nr:hypothetical protein [Urbanus proteus nucleopolyhedrovirus]AKR17393.1 hypothetical protein [Urbanus proteus nucleopolyhedrovirus]
MNDIKIEVLINDTITPHAKLTVDNIKNIHTYIFELSNHDATNKRLKILINSNQRRFLQAMFKCRDKHIAIVNASDKDKPIKFDGFIHPADESHTTPFILKPLNSILNVENLKVRKIVELMEKATVVKIFINEAHHKCSPKKWYSSLWFFKSLNRFISYDKHAMDSFEQNETQLKENVNFIEEDDKIIDNYVSAFDTVKNPTVWVPVECYTGRLLLTINLIFKFI